MWIRMNYYTDPYSGSGNSPYGSKPGSGYRYKEKNPISIFPKKFTISAHKKDLSKILMFLHN